MVGRGSIWSKVRFSDVIVGKYDPLERTAVSHGRVAFLLLEIARNGRIADVFDYIVFFVTHDGATAISVRFLR